MSLHEIAGASCSSQAALWDTSSNRSLLQEGQRNKELKVLRLMI